MSKRRNNLEYDKLRAEWYEKLQESGFSDIESDDFNLKNWSSKLSRKHTVEQWQAKEAYYSMASNFLNDYQFEAELDKVIWEYHANAISIRNIVELLKSANISKPYRDGVFTTIKRLKETMRDLYAPKPNDDYDN